MITSYIKIKILAMRRIYAALGSKELIVQEKTDLKSTSYLEENIRYEIELFSSLVQLPQVQQCIITRKCCVPGCKSQFV